MKLYYTPGACSLAPHIVLRETDVPFELERVDLGNHTTERGIDFLTVNSRGQVPVLESDACERLTEASVIAQYVADVARSPTLPRFGSQRYRVLEWQSYVGTELHKSFAPLFNSNFPGEARAFIRDQLRTKYVWLETRLPAGAFLTGETFTIADAYLFTVTRWSDATDLDLSDLSRVQAYMRRAAERPAVRDALHAEGLD